MAVPSFWRHVSALHADSDIGFSKEYEEVQRLSQSKECDFPFDHCKHPENKIKNRYLNIVACESTIQLMSSECRTDRPTHSNQSLSSHLFQLDMSNCNEMSYICTVDKIQGDNSGR